MQQPAPVVNQELAELLANEPNPIEPLAEDQSYAMVWKTGLSAKAMLRKGRLALLVCGHFTVTKARHHAKCPRCGEMIRAGYDYDAYRNLGGDDTFSWPADPLRPLHEKRDNTDGLDTEGLLVTRA